MVISLGRLFKREKNIENKINTKRKESSSLESLLISVIEPAYPVNDGEGNHGASSSELDTGWEDSNKCRHYQRRKISKMIEDREKASLSIFTSNLRKGYDKVSKNFDKNNLEVYAVPNVYAGTNKYNIRPTSSSKWNNGKNYKNKMNKYGSKEYASNHNTSIIIPDLQKNKRGMKLSYVNNQTNSITRPKWIEELEDKSVAPLDSGLILSDPKTFRWKNKDAYIYSVNTYDNNPCDLEFVIYIPIETAIHWLDNSQWANRGRGSVGQPGDGRQRGGHSFEGWRLEIEDAPVYGGGYRKPSVRKPKRVRSDSDGTVRGTASRAGEGRKVGSKGRRSGADERDRLLASHDGENRNKDLKVRMSIASEGNQGTGRYNGKYRNKSVIGRGSSAGERDRGMGSYGGADRKRGAKGRRSSAGEKDRGMGSYGGADRKKGAKERRSSAGERDRGMGSYGGADRKSGAKGRRTSAGERDRGMGSYGGADINRGVTRRRSSAGERYRGEANLDNSGNKELERGGRKGRRSRVGEENRRLASDNGISRKKARKKPQSSTEDGDSVMGPQGDRNKYRKGRSNKDEKGQDVLPKNSSEQPTRHEKRRKIKRKHEFDDGAGSTKKERKDPMAAWKVSTVGDSHAQIKEGSYGPHDLYLKHPPHHLYGVHPRMAPHRVDFHHRVRSFDSL